MPWHSGRGPRRPPWWPEGEPWPPARSGRRPPRRMIVRAGLVIGVVLLLSVVGAASLISLVIDRSGLGLVAGQVTVTIALLVFGALAFVTALLMAMRRLAVPIGHIVSAADRAGP